MPRWTAIGLFLGLQGCTGRAAPPSPDGERHDRFGIVLPDTQTVDGVLVMRHTAAAFERAPQWQLDATPVQVIDGGERFDLTHVWAPVPLPDGRSVILNSLGGGQLMLFDATGAPERLLARTGQGPGELMNPGQPSVLGDTIVVVDGANRTVNRYTAAGGLVSSRGVTLGEDPGCWSVHGSAANGDRLSLHGCYTLGPDDPPTRRPTMVAWMAADFSRVDTVLTVPGFEMVRFETRFRGVSQVYPSVLRLGLRPVVTAWEGGIAAGNGREPSVLSLHDAGGVIRGRIAVERARRPVTPAMRDAKIAEELARIEGPQREGMVDPEESRRQAREMPFADSLPPYQVLLGGAEGTLWAVDGQTLGDSTWTATVFGRDGAIVARVQGARMGIPVGLWGNNVVVREVDGDGVVRFGVYRVAGG